MHSNGSFGLGYEIVVVGASAGGIEALTHLVAGLPQHFPVPILLVVHVSPYATSNLPAILSGAGPLPASHAQDGELLQSGHIYVAPPNHHLLVEDGKARLSLGVRVNRTRPAIDPLFLSASQTYGPRAVGVVLSGVLDDGTVGLMEIKRRGGVAIVQDPQEALFSSMPKSAIACVAVDHILSSLEMGQALSVLVQAQFVQASHPLPPQEQVQEQNEDKAPMQTETERILEEMPPAAEIVEQDISAQEQNARDGMLSVFVCPECGGALWQVNAGTLVRFRCHTGHTMSGESLFVGQAENVENSLWYAARSLRDKARLARQLANNMRQRGSEAAAARFETKAKADDVHADMLERIIEDNAAIDRAP